MKILFMTLTLVSFIFADEVKIEKKLGTYDNKDITIKLNSINSINGIKMHGDLNVKSVGDMYNFITGPADLYFKRESDGKFFKITTPVFGFKPKSSCVDDYLSNEIAECRLNTPIPFEINKPFNTGHDFLEIITIDSSLLKVVQLFNFARGYSSHDVYKIINTKEEFRAKFLYNLPENAEWNNDGSFTFDNPGGAAVDSKETYGEVEKDEWKLIKRTYYGMSYDSGPQYDKDGEWIGYCTLEKIEEYNYTSGILETIKDKTTCPN